MEKCKLKKGDRIYECRYHEATLIELITDPELIVQGSDSHYWHWKAKVIETQSRKVVPGEIVEFGITEEAPAYGPKLFRKNMYEFGYDEAEPVLPPFDTSQEEKIMIRIEEKDDKSYIYGIPEIEGCSCYSWGENLLHVSDNEYGEYLVNQVTGKVRKIVERGKLVGFSDEEIDFESIDKLENSHNAHTRDIDYAGINRWTNCKNGLIALSWMLYPDGRYFADEDGFGMEDNDEVTVYCVMNEDLEVIRPFAPVEDVPCLLGQLAQEKK